MGGGKMKARVAGGKGLVGTGVSTASNIRGKKKEGGGEDPKSSAAESMLGKTTEGVGGGDDPNKKYKIVER